MKMRAFCECSDHQMIPSVRFKIMSNIKTLASITPRISAMSTSAVLFLVMVPRASCISSNSRYLARYIKDPGKKEGCWVDYSQDQLSTRRNPEHLPLRLAKSYPSPNPCPNLSLLKCSKQGNTSSAAACSYTMNGLQGSPLAWVRKELAHL